MLTKSNSVPAGSNLYIPHHRSSHMTNPTSRL
jgi:hypothetical protein